MRLIDADALSKIMEIMMVRCQALQKKQAAQDYNFVITVLDTAPTVDAVPVVHGPCDWCNGEYHTKIIATAIRYHSNGNMDGYEMKVNHCPHCGAKMDGGNKDA